MDSSGQLIFVYGSLKRGYRLHFLLAAQPFLGSAVTICQYRLFDLGEYPGLIGPVSDGIAITGEVYRVTAECLQTLDEAEGVDSQLYSRRQVVLAGEFAEFPVEAWFWLSSTSGRTECGSSWPRA